MHELSIAISIAEIAAEAAARQEARVLAVHLKLGVLAGVENAALVAAWELARVKTLLGDAALVIEDLPGFGTCSHCVPHESEIRTLENWCCPRCGALLDDVHGGRELEISALEVEA